MTEKWCDSTINAKDKAARRLEVTYRRIDELKLDPKNPRDHTKRHIRQVGLSIESFGFNIPIVIDANDKVICRHARVLASKSIGWIEVPTIKLEHLNESQARAFMIADNRLNEVSTWNDELLAEQLKELSLQDLDFSLEATGFQMGEIDLRIQTSLTLSDSKEDSADDLRDALKGPPVSRLGDLWLLLKHRILCASALERSSYACLMQGRLASAVFGDPPYNVPIVGNVSGLGAHKHREFSMASGEMSSSEFETFLTSALTLLARNSVDGSIHYVCMDWRHVKEILTAGHVAYSELKNICVWVKNNAGMGSFYRSQHELILVFKNGRAPHRNSIQLGQYGRSRTNVWSYPSVNSFGRSSDEGNLLALHPTVKPVALVADAILDCTARGEIVLDGFLGSGTTALAAARTGRHCHGLEIDPRYVDTIVRRLQKFTGATAIHAPPAGPSTRWKRRRRQKMSTERDGEYKVGYRKPPVNKRFQKGHSGNPRGRPSDSKNLTTLIDKELDARILVSENGKNERIPKRRAFAKRLINSALEGDHRAAQLVLQNQDRGGRVSKPSSSKDDPPARARVSDEELDRVLARLTPQERDAMYYILDRSRGEQNPQTFYLSDEIKAWFQCDLRPSPK